ncbi:hypothetical protein FisN_1Hh408 [Fistulifera solaris]|uniref:EamA domain-containing protein n=1 Tax=Fistulifera solaris TaxID=1519565 RepID=A0A1Z5KH97_FISSO|nr:hypothetical protein FisN_1Hh408 [Fistulifera solaris]|eukprot:GAX25452.1 hypothetical protein FisN_1Hh408 [Fistulifera solaris]
MGSSNSSLRQAPSSPSLAYGRLRFDSPKSQASPGRRLLQRAAAERDGLLFGSKVTTKGGSMDPRTLVELVSSDSLHSVASPPLAVWIGPALLCALAYAFYNIFIKKGSASIHPILGGVVLQIVAALLGSLLLAYIVIQNSEDEENVLYWDAAGIRWAVCAGAAVGAAEILSFFVSSLGVQAMQSIPTIIGGSVFFGCVLGACLLHEVLTFRGWFGVFLICVGITLVGLEPAVEGAH